MVPHEGADQAPDELPRAVARYDQAHVTERLQLPDGGYTKPGGLYVAGVFEKGTEPVALSGPYRSDHELAEALRNTPVQREAKDAAAGGDHA